MGLLLSTVSTIGILASQVITDPGPDPGGDFRYYRITVSETNDASTFVDAKEVRLAYNGVEIDPSGVTLTASSSYDGTLDIANANDENLSTAWSSDGSALPAWIKFDLGSPMPVNELWWYARFGNVRMPRDFIVEGSNDDSTWTKIATYENFTGDVQYASNYMKWWIGVCPGTTSSMWRITSDELFNASDKYFDIVEIKFSAGGIDIVPDDWFISATATFDVSANAPGFAIDDDTGTRWSSNGVALPQSLIITTKEDIFPDTVHLRSAFSTRFPRNFTLDYSGNNGTTWNNALTETGIGSNSSPGAFDSFALDTPPTP